MRLTNTREIAMISDDVRFRYMCNRNAFRRCVPVTVERKWTQLEREWNANGTRMERKWNANGTHLGTRSGRVPNAFSVRLFLSSTVLVPDLSPTGNKKCKIHLCESCESFARAGVYRSSMYLFIYLFIYLASP
jgi:hypothetical protein